MPRKSLYCALKSLTRVRTAVSALLRFRGTNAIPGVAVLPYKAATVFANPCDAEISCCACVSRPTERLYLTWRSSDEGGAALARSPFIDEVLDLIRPDSEAAVTRLARGLPSGSNIEYANRNILADAISGRQRM